MSEFTLMKFHQLACSEKNLNNEATNGHANMKKGNLMGPQCTEILTQQQGNSGKRSHPDPGEIDRPLIYTLNPYS